MSGRDDSITILLVEDNLGDVRLRKVAFSEINIDATFHTVTDGKQALNFLAQEGEYEPMDLPDLVLLDLNLPRKNGHEVLEEMQRNPELAQLPVLVLTSSESKEDVEKSYRSCANAHLKKPADPEKLVSIAQSIEEFWFESAELPSK